MQETFDLGSRLGARLRGGEIIELSSDIGGGKTVFVRGLVDGIKSHDQVSSPTFTINRIYHSVVTGITVHHFDFYRLTDPGIIAHEIGEIRADSKAVIVIEWSGVVKDVLPDDVLHIEIKSTGESSRHITLAAGKDHLHLLGGIRQ